MTLNIERFVKRPVEITAVQVTEDNAHAVAHWCQGTVLDRIWHASSVRSHETGLQSDLFPKVVPAAVLIDTLEGTMRAEIGDWVIRGIQGEFYPCKPDIFEQTYEFAGSLQHVDQHALPLDL